MGRNSEADGDLFNPSGPFKTQGLHVSQHHTHPLVVPRRRVASISFQGAATRQLLVSLIVCASSLTVGCATTSTAKDGSSQRPASADTKALLERVEEVERTNGRLTVRMEELEEQLFLLNDRVESHRIALQRRTYQPQAYAAAQPVADSPQAPQPAPESYYYEGQPARTAASTPIQRAKPQRPIKRIQLEQPVATSAPSKPLEETSKATTTSNDDEPYEEVVISEEEYRAFFGEPSSMSDNQPSSSSTSSTGRRAQPPVTSEKLGGAGGKETNASPSPVQSSSASIASPSSTGLQLYKDSLAQYRAGNYHHALVGFQAFLKSKPKRDYVDNALYWIGECHYGLGDYSSAIQHFERVLNEEPDGNKVPDAMLKMSLAMEKSGQGEGAKKLLQNLVDEYPQTHAAGLGRKRLEQ